MKIPPVFLVMLSVCVVLFFFAPHHRRSENTFKATTMGEIYAQFFRDGPEITSPRLLVFMLLGLAGIAASFYPAILVVLARWVAPAGGQPGGALFVLGGLAAAAGAFANFIAILVSHMTFGFGGGGSEHNETAFCWIIPVFQLVFAVVSVAMGCSATLVGWMNRLLGQ